LNSWFIRAGSNGEKLGRFKDDEIAGVSYGEKACFDLSGLSKDEIDERLNVNNDDERDNNADQLFDVSQIKNGDLIAITPPGNGNSVEVFGIATSDYYFDGKDAEGMWHRVDVEYLGFGTDEFGQGTRKGIMRDAGGRIEEFLEKQSVNPTSSSDRNMPKVMVKSILWRKLPKNDFLAMHNKSGVRKTGNGAQHIALGKNNVIDVAGFLDVEQNKEITETIDAYFINDPHSLTLSSDPGRRDGEWRINKQYSNRHPAWNSQNQFPTTYDENNAPFIYITKTDDGNYHARFILSDQISTLDLPDFILDEWKKSEPGGKGVCNFPETPQLDDESNSILNELKLHHNVLLYGPPGTGKTHFMQQLFSYFENRPPLIEFLTSEAQQPFKINQPLLPLPSISKWLTFHQSYSYEEFILGLRPEPQGNGTTLKPKAGVLLEISENIKKTKGSAILFIDEINRANISSVFGEFITAIESDKRLNPNGQPNPGKTIPINLTYLGKDDKVKFADDTHKISNPYSFPYHIYVIASMNSLDRSVTPIDSALARRFFRINIEPNYDTLQKRLGLSNSNYNKPNTPEEVSIMLLKRVNMIISAVLGDDFQFGHSYFWNVYGTEDEKWKAVADAFEGNIYPQLKELLRSQPETLATILKINEGTAPPSAYPYKKDTESKKLIDELDMEISPAILNTPFSSPITEEIKKALRFLARKEA